MLDREEFPSTNHFHEPYKISHYAAVHTTSVNGVKFHTVKIMVVFTTTMNRAKFTTMQYVSLLLRPELCEIYLYTVSTTTRLQSAWPWAMLMTFTNLSIQASYEFCRQVPSQWRRKRTRVCSLRPGAELAEEASVGWPLSHQTPPPRQTTGHCAIAEELRRGREGGGGA